MSEGSDEIVARWAAAEDRLHPLVLAQPETYERYLRLVRSVANELQHARSREQLVELHARAGAIVQSAIARGGLSAEGLNLHLVAGAAFGVRYREVVAELRRDEVGRRIRAAVDRGEEWVVLYDAGGAGGPGLPPYRKLEMHLPDGQALHAFIELDSDTDGAVFGVEAVPLDPDTGAGTGPPSESHTFADAESWELGIEDLRARFRGSSA